MMPPLQLLSTFSFKVLFKWNCAGVLLINLWTVDHQGSRCYYKPFTNLRSFASNLALPLTSSCGEYIVNSFTAITEFAVDCCLNQWGLKVRPTSLFSFFLSIGPRWLMARIYCGHIGLLYYPQTFQISPLVSFFEVLAARGGDVYEPSYFRLFQLSPLVVFKRSQQRMVELHGRENDR